jgi:predicted glycosyltransferase
MPARILIHVQHLLGIGHLRRAATLARGLAADGHEVAIASGGTPVPGLDLERVGLHQLPPVRSADETFKILLDENDRPIDDAWRHRRRRSLLDLFHAFRPDLLLIEMFPFGRRALRFELLPLLDAAEGTRPRTLVLGSVRDILVHRPASSREVEFLETVRRFDRILVHGDARLIPLDASFPLAERIADRLDYTGYLLDLPPPKESAGDAGRGEVLVSAGGGAVGESLLRAALDARAAVEPAQGGRVWRFLLGPNLPTTLPAELRAKAPPTAVVEPARKDFVELLRRCDLSISQAGYNTLMETVAVGARAVVVPFARGSETEQTDRAFAFRRLGLVDAFDESELTPRRLAEAVRAALARPRPPLGAVAVDGLPKSVASIREALQRRMVPMQPAFAAGYSRRQ